MPSVLTEPEGQLLQIQGSTSTEVAVSLEHVLQGLRSPSSEDKVKFVFFLCSVENFFIYRELPLW